MAILIRSIFALVLCLSLYVAPTSTATAQSSKADPFFRSDAGRFAVLFPFDLGEPVFSEQSMTSMMLGRVSKKIYTATSKARTAMVAYIDYPQELMSSVDATRMLESGQAGALQNMGKSTLVKQEDVAVDGHPGRSIVYTVENGGKQLHVRMIMYVVKERVYQISFVSDQSSDLAREDVVRFFDSFALLASSESDPTTNPFASKEGRFSISFPSGFDKPRRSQDVEQGREVTMYLAADGNNIALVTYSDYPKKRFDGMESNAVLDGLQKEVLRTMGNSKAISHSDIAIDGHPGRNVAFTAMQDGTTLYGLMNFYLAGERFYQIVFASANPDDLKTQSVKEFFDSFKLTKTE